MDEWLKENNINRYSTFGDHKSAVVERFNRTLKEKMWKRFTAENTRNWIDMLDRLLSEYNERVHSTIGMTPIKSSKIKSHEMKILDKILSKPKFKIGNKVRISRIKGLFEKGYLPNWSEAIYLIHEVKQTSPVTYILKDTADEVLVGGFYENELQKTKQEIYRIEKVLRKKIINGAEHALVKWMGYSDKFNEWIPTKNLLKC